MSTLPERYVDAVRRRDRAGLAALFAPDVSFVGLTPGRSWEASTPDEVVDVVLGHWFEESDEIEGASLDSGDPVSDTARMAYRFDILNEDGPQVVEQQAYYRVEGERLAWVRVVCSGFRPRD